jgi:hypothetical protein
MVDKMVKEAAIVVMLAAAQLAVRISNKHKRCDDVKLVAVRSPRATSRNRLSLQTEVLVDLGPSHPHDDPGTQTQAEKRCLLGLLILGANRHPSRNCSKFEHTSWVDGQHAQGK